LVDSRGSAGVLRAWHAWREAHKNLGDPSVSLRERVGMDKACDY